MKKEDFKKIKLPKSPGVYVWKGEKGEILYIGKATNLADRVKSYFAKDIIDSRGMHILDMVALSKTVDYTECDSALEALILESNLIKRYKPKYNTKEKDDKSYNCVVITKEDFPKILIVRYKDLNTKEKTFSNRRLGEDGTQYSRYYGPFPSGTAIREALHIIRRIFPFRDNYSSKKHNYEFYRQLDLSPDIKDSEAKKKYSQTIKNIERFFESRKQSILTDLRSKMSMHAKKQEFEEAEKVKRTIMSLTHINDIALIKRDFDSPMFIGGATARIEAYDISHMSGKNMVGVMVVVENGQPIKSEYKKFTIRGQDGADDTRALGEVLSRRLAHTEWRYPDVLVVDGGLPQIKVARAELAKVGLEIPVVSVVKNESHKPKGLLGDETILKKYKFDILLANSESHRFAVSFHKLKRGKIW